MCRPHWAWPEAGVGRVGQASGRRVFHVTLVNWWLLDTEPVSLGRQGSVLALRRGQGVAVSRAHPCHSWEPLFQLTSVLASEQDALRPLRDHPLQGLHSAPQSPPVSLEVDPCPPSQCCKLTLQAMKIIHFGGWGELEKFIPCSCSGSGTIRGGFLHLIPPTSIPFGGAPACHSWYWPGSGRHGAA